MRKFLMFLVVFSISVAANGEPDIVTQLKNNSAIEALWYSQGPCNPKISLAKHQVRKNNRDVSLQEYKLDCRALITMKFRGGRMSFMYILPNGKTIGFGSDGEEHRDDRGSYVEIDHFYPYSDTPWSGVNRASDGNGMIGENISGRCYWGPHKVTKQTVLLCTAAYFPSDETNHIYSWSIEITEEYVEVVKKSGEGEGEAKGEGGGRMYNTPDKNVRAITQVIGKCNPEESYVAVITNGHEIKTPIQCDYGVLMELQDNDWQVGFAYGNDLISFVGTYNAKDKSIDVDQFWPGPSPVDAVNRVTVNGLIDKNIDSKCFHEKGYVACGARYEDDHNSFFYSLKITYKKLVDVTDKWKGLRKRNYR